MKYKEGDKVRIRKDLVCNEKYGKYIFYNSMEVCAIEHDYILTILIANDHYDYYVMLGCCFPSAPCWTDEMIEGLAEKPPIEASRAYCLEQAKEIVCKDRDEQYGEPEDSFPVIANLWSAYKGVEFTPEEAAMMLGLLKVARTKTGKYKADNYIDLAGYTACACELAAKENKNE